MYLRKVKQTRKNVTKRKKLSELKSLVKNLKVFFTHFHDSRTYEGQRLYIKKG